ncbi:hypothetical protein [Puniceibacterium sediminis]|nr:hypothetical protein [Puniceibacterium sediminis]
MSPIYNPDRNEIHFSLAYGTNHPEGMDVMRRAEFKALSSHDQTQFKKTQKKTGPDLFDCLEETMEYRGPYLRARQEHRLTASKLVASLLDAETNGIEFIQLAAKVQEKKFLTRTEIGDVLMDMSREGTIKPSWMDRGGKRPVGGDVLCLA